MANGVNPDQTATLEAVWSEFTMFPGDKTVLQII